MNILVLNIGSATIKYSVFQAEREVLKGIVYYEGGNTFAMALKSIVKKLEKKRMSIHAVGHRVVHGGSINRAQRVTSTLLHKLKQCSELAPLHNPPQLKGILECRKHFKIPHVAVFDTAFHQNMPEKAYTYALPKKLAEKYGIRRFGFHGISCQYVLEEACKRLRWNKKTKKIILCHLGNGCSVTAVKEGTSVDTSMGFTPLEGLVMGTRSGDVDPGALLYLMHRERRSVQAMEKLLNEQSGLKGLTGTSDMRKLLQSKTKQTKQAIEVFCYRLAKYLAGYIVALGGVDALVFTGGMGEQAWQIRKRVMEYYTFRGIQLDEKKNRKNAWFISKPSSAVSVLVIPTNEALMIAREVERIVRKDRENL